MELQLQHQSNDWCPFKMREIWTWGQSPPGWGGGRPYEDRDGAVSQGSPGPPEAKKWQEGLSPGASPRQLLDFGLPASPEGVHFCYFKPPRVWPCGSRPGALTGPRGPSFSPETVCLCVDTPTGEGALMLCAKSPRFGEKNSMEEKRSTLAKCLVYDFSGKQSLPEVQ